jgi:hypothetical protein
MPSLFLQNVGFQNSMHVDTYYILTIVSRRPMQYLAVLVKKCKTGHWSDAMNTGSFAQETRANLFLVDSAIQMFCETW